MTNLTGAQKQRIMSESFIRNAMLAPHILVVYSLLFGLVAVLVSIEIVGWKMASMIGCLVYLVIFAITMTVSMATRALFQNLSREYQKLDDDVPSTYPGVDPRVPGADDHVY